MKTIKKIKRSSILNKKTILISSLLIFCIFFLSFTVLTGCGPRDRKITGEELSETLKEIDEDVRVSREKVEEFEQLEREDFNIISTSEILDLISFDYQYSTQEETSGDSDVITADFIDGRKVMIVRFKIPGKIESFYLQFQSNLYNQGYNFEDRLKYSDLCNSFINEEQGIKAYLLKKENYFIVLIK